MLMTAHLAMVPCQSGSPSYPPFAPSHTTSAKCAGGSEHIVRGAGRLCSGLVAVPLYNKSDDQIGLAHTPFIPRSAVNVILVIAVSDRGQHIS